tara:strand:- start:179 stop:1456 length:1278 start_codon:yes stop_codon:yes gene_type:complete
MKKELKFAALTAVITLTLAGCASNPDSASNLAADAEQSETITQINEFKKTQDDAEQQVSQGVKDELSWFATKEVEEANKALAEAKEYYAEFEFDPSEANSSTGLFTSTTNLEAAKESISQFNSYMDKARSLKAASLSTLSEAFDYRTQLIKIDANTYFPSTIKELDEELKKLVDQIAQDNANDAIKGQPELVAKQRALEVKTVTKIYLSDAQQELDKLVKSDINQHAPKSLSQVSASLNATIAFIASNPRAIDEIKEKADSVLFSAKRAEQIALTVKKLKALSQKDYEDYVTSYEKILFEVSYTLGTKDKRDLSFEQQGKALIAFVEAEMKNKDKSEDLQQELRKKLKDQESYSELLEEKISTLTANLADVKKSLADSLEEKEAAKAKQAAAEKDEAAEKTALEASTEAEVQPETTEQTESTTAQ